MVREGSKRTSQRRVEKRGKDLLNTLIDPLPVGLHTFCNNFQPYRFNLLTVVRFASTSFSVNGSRVMPHCKGLFETKILQPLLLKLLELKWLKLHCSCFSWNSYSFITIIYRTSILYSLLFIFLNYLFK